MHNASRLHDFRQNVGGFFPWIFCLAYSLTNVRKKISKNQRQRQLQQQQLQQQQQYQKKRQRTPPVAHENNYNSVSVNQTAPNPHTHTHPSPFPFTSPLSKTHPQPLHLADQLLVTVLLVDHLYLLAQPVPGEEVAPVVAPVVDLQSRAEPGVAAWTNAPSIKCGGGSTL